MKILSFDVGIKNLAYCLIDSNDKIIDDWGILDVSIDDHCTHCNSKTGKQCDKSAKFVCCDSDLKLCSAHKNLKCYIKHKKKAIPKSKNPLMRLGQNIVRELNKYPDFLKVNTILIENQPALKNPTMKSIQMILYSYFLINGVTNIDSPIKDIEMINARNKLKAYKGDSIECKIKDKYKRNKFLAIQYCNSMINNNCKIDQKFRDKFESSKKKDDLSDCYLQGIYWLTK